MCSDQQSSTSQSTYKMFEGEIREGLFVDMLNFEQLQDKGTRVDQANEYTGLEFRIQVKTEDANLENT